MSEPAGRSSATRLNAVVTWLARIVTVATVIVALQILALIAFGMLPLQNWYALAFLFSGFASLFGSIGLLVFRRSAGWLLTLAISLLGWFLAYYAMLGIGIARMH